MTRPKGVFMNDGLLYLDKEYISNKYEEIKNVSASVRITKTEGLNAGVKIPLFSAGASAVESKSYELSTNAMLIEILDELKKLLNFDPSSHDVGKPSSYCWVNGTMSISKITLKRNKYTLTIIGEPKESQKKPEELISEETYFCVKDEKGNKFALLANGEYFASGIQSIAEYSSTLVNEVSFPIQALIRVLPVKNEFNEWASVPLIIREKIC